MNSLDLYKMVAKTVGLILSSGTIGASVILTHSLLYGIPLMATSVLIGLHAVIGVKKLADASYEYITGEIEDKNGAN